MNVWCGFNSQGKPANVNFIAVSEQKRLLSVPPQSTLPPSEFGPVASGSERTSTKQEAVNAAVEMMLLHPCLQFDVPLERKKILELLDGNPVMEEVPRGIGRTVAVDLFIQLMRDSRPPGRKAIMQARAEANPEGCQRDAELSG